MLIGYARTSTADQAGLATQEQALKSFGVERIFTEQALPVANRIVLKVCLGFLQENDYLIVTRADRLAASVTHLLAIIDDLDRRGIGLAILAMGGQTLDTRLLANKPILATLAGVASMEREITLERQRRGTSGGGPEGRCKGRPRSINPDDVKTLLATMSVTKIARKLDISRSSAYRMLQQGPRTS
jgi:DNA invertase Pin-like site-specific DNA recombinase